MYLQYFSSYHRIYLNVAFQIPLFFLFMHNVQWIHKIAKANDRMYPDYRDTKLFLNVLISLGDATENDKIFQTTTACEKKRRNKKSMCESGVVEG